MTELYHTQYDLSDRIFLIIWCLICLIAGSIGNGFTIFSSILVSSKTGLDHFTATLLRNLAVSDQVYIITRILPSLISHIAGGWILGDKVCYVEGLVFMLPVLVSMALVLALSCIKAVVCVFPLRTTGLFNSTFFRRGLVMFIWFQAALPLIMAALTRQEVVVNQELETICELTVNRTSSVGYAINVVLNVQMWIPTVCVIPCNLILWLIARRYTRSHNLSNKKAVTTVLAISLLFVVSWMPHIIEQAWRVFDKSPHIPLWFNKVHINFYFLSVVGNPILYALINQRYRDAVSTKMTKRFCSKDGQNKVGLQKGIHLCGDPSQKSHTKSTPASKCEQSVSMKSSDNT